MRFNVVVVVFFFSWLRWQLQDIVMKLVHSCGYFRKLSCRLGVIRMMFGILKRATSLFLWTLWQIFALFLGGDVSDN